MKVSRVGACLLIGLAGLVLIGLYGHAQPVTTTSNKPALASNNKVIIYPAASERIDQLTERGFAKVKSYGSFWLVEATDAQVAELVHMYGARAVKANDLNRIRLRNLSFDTTEGDPTVPADLRQQELTGKNLRLIQFRGPVIPQWLQQIQSVGGVEVICYVPNNAYLIQVDQRAEKKLRALEGPGGPIQWLGPYHPYYKIQPGLWTEGDQKNDSLVNVRVMVAPHSENSDTMKAIEKIGFVNYSYNRANQTAQFLTVPVSTVAQMARLPDVIWIEKEYPKKLLDEVQDLVLAGQTNGIGHGPVDATTGITNYLDFLFTQVAGDQIDAFVNPLTYPVVDVADTGIDSGPLGGTVIFGTNRPIIVSAPVHPAFHFLGDARNFSRVVYDVPPWIGGDPDSQLGCANVHLGANDGPFKQIESMDLVGHGTAVASIIAGFDDGTNILDQPCLQLVSASNTWLVTFPGSSITDTNTGAVDAITNGLSSCPIIASTNVTIGLPTGFSETCGPGGTPPNATFTNVLVTISSNACPTNVFIDVLFTAIVTNKLSQIRVDGNGNQLGMGISPFGLLGNSRIWQNYQADLAISGSPPGTGIFGLGALAVSGGCQLGKFDTELGKCVTDIPSLIALAYFLGRGTGGARIQNNSWSDNIGAPPVSGGQYNADCVSYDIAVRDASLVGSSNNIPGPSPLNQEFIVVFACASSFGDAGNNSGNGGFPDIFITAPATAKNVISVGVADNPRFPIVNDVFECFGADSQDMPVFAANGPTLDGRFKPEIVAPGANVSAALSQIVAVTTNCSLDKTLFPTYPGIVACTNPPCDGAQGPIYTSLYSCFGGSSYAAPAVSGAIQLLWWYFQNRLTDELGDPLLQPSPAMAKAYVCNAARYLPIADPFRASTLDTLPSTLQGMGELDLQRMFDGVPRVIRDESSPRAISVPLTTTNPAPQQTYFSQSGQTYTLSGQIASNDQPFRVTLAWIDPPGATFAKVELVNNLDLSVVIDGVTYKGNVFAKNVSVTRPGDAFDTVNNMESVFLNPTSMLNGIPAVAAGTPFQVTVTANNIAAQGVPNVGEPSLGSSNVLNQDFALVVYNANNVSDVPNLTTNNSCSTAMDVTSYPFSFTNTLTSATYHQAFPSPNAGTGGPEEFFRIPLPTPGAVISVNTIGSSFDNVLSVWEVQVVPQTVLIRGECGALTEVVSTNQIINNQPSSQVSFTADGTNDYFIVVEPHNNGTGGQMVLNVTSSGVPITLTPSSLIFSNQEVVGTTSSPLVVTYLNGTAVPVTISSVSITGPGSNDFVITSQNCANDTLRTGGNCSVFVAFAPTMNGTRQANLVITDDAVGSPRVVPLRGTATPPAPLVCLSSSSSISFSNQTVGTTSTPPQSVTITNCGSLPLAVSNVTFTGSAAGDFLIAPPACTNAPILVGGMCTLQLSFAPSRAGTRQATLVITHNAGSSTTVAVQGVGVTPAPALCFSSGSISFGSVGIGATGSMQSVTITNCGTAALVISNIIVTGANAGDFVNLSTACGTVNTGDTCTVSLQLAPSAAGTRSATLVVSNNTVGSPQLLSLIGSGSLSQPDAAIGKSTKLKKMVGFGAITNDTCTSGTDNRQTIRQNVHRKVIKPGVNCHGTKYFVALKNVGSGSDRFMVQLTPDSDTATSGFIVKVFLGAKPSESLDVTTAAGAATLGSGTMGPGAVTGDATMIRVEVCADKAVAHKGDTGVFCLKFTSTSDPSKQDTVRITAVAR